MVKGTVWENPGGWDVKEIKAHDMMMTSLKMVRNQVKKKLINVLEF